MSCGKCRWNMSRRNIPAESCRPSIVPNLSSVMSSAQFQPFINSWLDHLLIIVVQSQKEPMHVVSQSPLQCWNSCWLVCPRDWLLLWRIWEWLVAGCVWQSAASLSLTLAHHLLCLLGVLAGVALERLSGTASVLSCHIADLCSLS